MLQQQEKDLEEKLVQQKADRKQKRVRKLEADIAEREARIRKIQEMLEHESESSSTDDED